MLYLVVFGLYSNLWTQTIDWVVVVPLLLVVGAFVEDADSPPGLTGRIWARMGAMRRTSPARQENAESASEASASVSEASPSRDRSLAKGLVVVGLGVLVVLLISGWAIQRLLPEPYPEIASLPLPASSANAREAMTNSDLTSDNQPLYWATVHGDRVELSEFEPVAKTTTPAGKVTIPALDAQTQFDIGAWAPWRNLALFSMTQGPSRLSITIAPTRSGEGRPQRFSAPIAPATEGATNKFMIATWSGTKPDLFIVTSGSSDSRALIRVLSGESGFQRQLFTSPLPFRGLSPEQWSFDVGQLATIPKEDPNRSVVGARPDLMMVHHEPGREHSSVEVLLGEAGFLWDAFQRDLETPGDVPAGTEFLLGTNLGATAVYQVGRHDPEGPRFQIFGLEGPPQFR